MLVQIVPGTGLLLVSLPVMAMTAPLVETPRQVRRAQPERRRSQARPQARLA